MYIEQMKELFDRCSEPNDQITLEGYMKDIVEYINRVVQEGSMLMMASAKMDQQDYVQYAETVWAARNSLHDKACLAVAAINAHCQRYNMKKIFPDFELVKAPAPKANQPGKFAIYDRETHRKTAEYGRILVNEFYYAGSLELEKLVADKEELIAGYHAPMTFDEMKEKAEEYTEKFSAPDLLDDLRDNKETQFTRIGFGDGTSICVYTGDSERNCVNEKDTEGYLKTADMWFDSNGRDMKDALGDLQDYFSKSGAGYEIPVGVIKDIAAMHDGFKELTHVRFKEKTLSFEDELKLAKQDALTDRQVSGDVLHQSHESEKDCYEL